MDEIYIWETLTRRDRYYKWQGFREIGEFLAGQWPGMFFRMEIEPKK